MMKFHTLLFIALLACGPSAAATSVEPVKVMIVGMFHMDNPGRDLHNVRVDDVLTTKRQGEIDAIVRGIAQFRPTMIDVEGKEPKTMQRYADYLKGRLSPSRDEVVQLGFRLGKQLDIPVHGIDVEGDFPYEGVAAYAGEHGQKAMLDNLSADAQREVDKIASMLRVKSIGTALRYVNAPATIRNGQDFYRQVLVIGKGIQQHGADLLTAWYKRNFYICANLVQLARPGDRVVAFYGAGHAFLLRQCVGEMPGYQLVEANDYLPR